MLIFDFDLKLEVIRTYEKKDEKVILGKPKGIKFEKGD
jgi:hypothetical protein